MMKYKVSFVAFDNDAWIHRYGERIIDAESVDDAKKIIRSWDNHEEEFYPENIEEI